MLVKHLIPKIMVINMELTKWCPLTFDYIACTPPYSFHLFISSYVTQDTNVYVSVIEIMFRFTRMRGVYYFHSYSNYRYPKSGA